MYNPHIHFKNQMSYAYVKVVCQWRAKYNKRSSDLCIKSITIIIF